MNGRTSQSDPLQISRVPTPTAGALGLTLCPGKRDPHAMSGAWDRDLEIDLKAIRDWPAQVLVTLIEDHEFDLLNVPDLGERAVDWGLQLVSPAHCRYLGAGCALRIGMADCRGGASRCPA
jgi:hypothetical protein